MTGQKFVVAPGCSFVGNKRTYVAGDEITESAFSKPEYFKKMTEGKNPKIIPSSGVSKSDDDEDLSGVDITGVGEIPTRENLEKLILEKGLLKESKIKRFSDEDLLKFAVKRGLIQK